MKQKQPNPIRRPARTMPEGATHHDSRYWYKDGGRLYWSNPYGHGYCWEKCHWGVLDPLNHIWSIDTPLVSELK